MINNLLKQAIDNGIINIEFVQEQLSVMKRNEILENYNIWEGKDGRFRCKFKDQNGHVRDIRRNTQEKVVDEIIRLLDDASPKNQSITMASLFDDWILYKQKETSSANANRIEWQWIAYLKENAITKMDIREMKTLDLKEALLDLVNLHNLTSRKYKDIKSTVNMIFDYAVEKEIIPINISRNIHNLSHKHFAKAEEKAVEKQIYKKDEEKRLLAVCLQHYQSTRAIGYLAIILNTTLGLRIGELAALRVCDIQDGILQIRRQMVRNYSEDRTAHGWKIVSYVKTKTSIRHLILTARAKETLNLILSHYGETSPDFLFIGKGGMILSPNAINKLLRKVNKEIKTVQKANHSIRKTCLSKMAASNELSDQEIQAFAGHKDFTTTQKYYLFPTENIKDRQEAYNRALDR